MSRLYLVRHGESTCNTVHRIAGMKDAPLTRLGRAQAAMAARSLRGVHIDLVVSSPLSRASSTADAVFDSTRENVVPRRVQDPRLMERDFGAWTLHSKAILQREYGVAAYESAMNGDSALLGAAETFGGFTKRVLDSFADIVVPALQQGQAVCVVAHKYVIELLAREVLQQDHGTAYDLRLPNSQAIPGGKVAKYVARESRRANIARDWVVVQHAALIAGSLIAGVLCGAITGNLQPPWWAMLIMLVVATVITITRVEVEDAAKYSFSVSSARRLALRFIGLPIVVLTALAIAGAPPTALVAALVSSIAPCSVVSATVSRCQGGMVTPTYADIVASSVLVVVTLPLGIWLVTGTPQWGATAVGVAATTGSVLLADLVVRALRSRRPIQTGRFSERHGYLAVVLLAAFAFLAGTSLHLADSLRFGLLSVGIVLCYRIVSRGLTRSGGVEAVDDYLAFAYPNLFFMILVFQQLGFGSDAQVASWAIVPMFLAALFDARYVPRLELSPEDPRWLSALGIVQNQVESPVSAAAGGGRCITHK
nr:histidine phosphatase family protein [Flexivirga aerilata]